MRPISRKLVAPSLLLAGGAGALVYTAVHNPGDEGWFPSCAIRAATGLWCPGCGMTRAVHHLLHGDVVQAVSYNLLVVPLTLMVVAVGIRALRTAGRQRALVGPVRIQWVTAGLAIVIAFTALRNLSPFAALRGG